MAINQYMCSSFKNELLQAFHNFGTTVTRAGTGADTFKIALYTSSATIDATTTAYSATNETSGTGYSAGGNTLTISNTPTIGNSSATSGTAWLSFSNSTWSTATISAAGALIYNSTQANRAVAVLSFGGTVSSTAGNFTVQFPAAAYNTAILQIGA